VLTETRAAEFVLILPLSAIHPTDIGEWLVTVRDKLPLESEPPTEPPNSPSRRALFKGLAVLPLAAATLSGCEKKAGSSENAGDSTATATAPYAPTFFKSAEWAFLHSACDRLIPADENGPGAVDLNVPEFIDRHMHTPYANGGIWYMQGPFVEAEETFGYQGRLSLREILRVGIDAVNKHCAHTFGGKSFDQIDHEQQEALLKSAESGKLELEGIGSKVFFAQLLAETRNGYFSDPIHGGNKDMGSWKMIGYPGVRADFLDWVEVRDRPYPFPPVSMAGRRG
jgi:gluconate 2-dehydrogenase gamma chain